MFKKAMPAGILSAVFMAFAVPSFADNNAPQNNITNNTAEASCPMDKPLQDLSPEEREKCADDKDFTDILDDMGFDEIQNAEDVYVYRLSGPIDLKSATKTIDSLRKFSKENPDKDIRLYINSPGGSIISALAIYDTMQSIPNDIQTVCEGWSMSAGFMLLTAGTEGKRTAMPNCFIMAHQSSGGTIGNIDDRALSQEYSTEQNMAALEVISTHTGWPVDILKDIMSHNVYMDAQQAIDMGFIDAILPPAKEAPQIQQRSAQDLPDWFCTGARHDVSRACVMQRLSKPQP